uniref:Uncharacterized protein n=2 Tax=Kalmanozyma brasiliensis (strain GHG001) TaxID=1365824 RepID=V5EST3_KALBG
MSCDDALSDISDEADGFFSLDMDVSIDQQLQDDRPAYTQPAPAISSRNGRLEASPQRDGRETSGSPLLHPAVRRASETVAYSSSPLQGVGLDPIMASRSRNSPALNSVNGNNTANTASNSDFRGVTPPSSFGPIAPEVDQKGNLEYKLKILPPSRERFDRLVTQLKWRLLEGGGTAVYEIGVLDDGTLIGLDPDSMKDSLKLLSLMAAEVGTECHVQRVLALEKVAATENDARTIKGSIAHPIPATSRLATSESDLSLRALSPAEAVEMLQPFVHTATHFGEHQRAYPVGNGAAGSYRFSIAQQQLIPPPLATLDADASASVAAVDPSDAAILASTIEDEVAMSAQTKRRLLKSTVGLPSRTKRDILQGLDQSAVIYLPSKEEKRLLRAAEAEHEAATAAAAADRALSHTEAQERRMMAKMTRVADSVQPKTARARARAKKSANGSTQEEESESPTPSPNMMPVTSTGAYAGYETVMSAFGVLSERAARTLYGADAEDGLGNGGVKGRLIVEAVVRRCVESVDNHADHQAAELKLGEGM